MSLAAFLSRFNRGSWLVLLAGLLLLLLSAAVASYRLALPTDGRQFRDEPGPGITLRDSADYDGTVITAVDGLPVEAIIQGAFTFQPVRPDNWYAGATVIYQTNYGDQAYQLARSQGWDSRRGDANWFQLPLALLWLLTGVTILLLRPGRTEARLLFLIGVTLLADSIVRLPTNGWGEIRLADYFYPFAFWPTLLADIGVALVTAMLFHLLLIYPRPKRPFRTYPRLTLSLVYGAALAEFGALAGRPLPIWLGLPAGLSGPVTLLMLLAVAGSAAHTVLTVRGTPAWRQARWIAWPALLLALNLALLLLALTIDGLLRFLGAGPAQAALGYSLVDLLYGSLAFVALLLPLSLALGLWRDNLFDVDRLINRTLVYGGTAALTIALYVVVVGVLGLLFQTSGNPWLAAPATGLAAILFDPLRRRLQQLVNRRMYGEPDDPATLLARLGERLEATAVPDAILPLLVQTLGRTLQLPYTAVTVHLAEQYQLAAEYRAGTEAGLMEIIPLVYQSEPVGQLLVARRAPGDPFSPDEARLLAQVAHEAAAVVHTIRLHQALQRARQQLVTAREEERRQIRRRLHDGLGAQLAGLTLKADAAQRQLAGDPVAAEALLHELRAETQAALADVRILVRRLSLAGDEVAG